MKQRMAVMAGAALGAGVMYLLDPDRGKRRRTLVREQGAHLAHQTRHMAERTAHDLKGRLQGAAATISTRFISDQPPNDVLVARVRARLGHLTQHPGALEVTAHQGRISVRGPICATDVERLRAGIRSVRGVRQVEESLEVYARGEEQPGLEGGTRGMEVRHERPAVRWSPTKRLLVAMSGGVLLLLGASTRGLLGTTAGIAGAGLCLRGLTNLRIERLIGLDRTQPVISLQKTLTVHAPVEEIFAVWSHYEGFPHLFPHVRAVRRITAEQSHWVVTGPLGFPVWWDAIVTKLVPSGVVAWNTLPGSLISHLGSVRFEAGSNGSTRLDILLAYTPPGGVFGHLLATLLGANPKQLMDADLVCFKSLLEDGRTRVHGQEIRREDLAGQFLAGEAELASPGR